MEKLLGMLLEPKDLHLVGGAMYAQTRLSHETNEALEAMSLVALAGDDPTYASAWNRAKILLNLHDRLSANSPRAQKAAYVSACRLEFKQNFGKWLEKHPEPKKDDMLDELRKGLTTFQKRIAPLYPPPKAPARPRHVGKYSRRATRSQGHDAAASSSLLDSIEKASAKRSQEIREGKGEVFVRFDPSQYLDPDMYREDAARERPWTQWDEERRAEEAAGPAPPPTVLTSIQRAVAEATEQADEDARGAAAPAQPGSEDDKADARQGMSPAEPAEPAAAQPGAAQEEPSAAPGREGRRSPSLPPDDSLVGLGAPPLPPDDSLVEDSDSETELEPHDDDHPLPPVPQGDAVAPESRDEEVRRAAGILMDAVAPGPSSVTASGKPAIPGAPDSPQCKTFKGRRSSGRSLPPPPPNAAAASASTSASASLRRSTPVRPTPPQPPKKGEVRSEAVDDTETSV